MTKCVILNSHREPEGLSEPQSTPIERELSKFLETLVECIELSFCLQSFQSPPPYHCTHSTHTGSREMSVIMKHVFQPETVGFALAQVLTNGDPSAEIC